MAREKGATPVQAIVGEDSYLAEQALERVLAAAVGEDRQDAVQVFQGDERKWEDVVSALRTGSLFASRRAVVVRRADQLKGEEEALAAWLGEPSPDVVLVLLAAKPDRRRSAWKKLLAAAEVHDAAPRKGRALRAHVEQELRRRGLRFAPGALDDLVSEVGADLRRLMGEVDKIEAWAGGRRDISGEDVAAVLGRGLGQPLYQLSDAYAERDRAATLALVERLLGGGEEGLRLLATLHRSARQVRLAKALAAEGTPPEEMAAALRLPPNMAFKVRDILDAARRWSEADLRRAMRVLGRTDRRMKRGADAATALVAAVAESCGGGGAATSPRRAR
jgi:DNA polymerase-3 subunit delta